MWLAGSLVGLSTSLIIALKQKINLDEILVKELKILNATLISTSNSTSNSIISANITSNLTSNTNSTIIFMSETAKVIKIIEDKINEALNLYSKNVIYCILEVDCTLRLAPLYEEYLNIIENESNTKYKVLKYVMRGCSIPGLNVMQQIECTLEAGMICNRIGLKRKYSLFVYIAALMSAECNHASMALKLVSYIYHLNVFLIHL